MASWPAPALAKEWTTVKIATEGAYPPWNATDSSGQLVGFELDLAKELCQRMGVECEIVAQDWEGIIPALQAGKYDAIMAGMSITEERQQVIDFTESYCDDAGLFRGAQGQRPRGGRPAPRTRSTSSSVEPDEQAAIDALKETLDGKAVGVQVATIHANFLESQLGDVVEVRKYDTQENLDLDLQAGRIDAALADMSYWKPLLETEKGAELHPDRPGARPGPVRRRASASACARRTRICARVFDKAIDEVRDGRHARQASASNGSASTPRRDGLN